MLLQESYFYFTSRALICSILEYRSPVFIQLYQVMISYLSEDQERLQKRAMKILYPELSYAKALELSGLLTLYHRRETNAAKLFAYRFSSKRETARRISTGWELKALLFRSMGRCESSFDMTACQALVQSQFQKKKRFDQLINELVCVSCTRAHSEERLKNFVCEEEENIMVGILKN